MIDVPIKIKDTLRDGRLKKNYRFNVLNDEDGTVDFTIDNDTLVKESVRIDERMNSGDTLKFGLCEGSSLEFQYFNHPNIRERQIQAFIDIQYKDDNGDLQWYEIPMGFFTVDQCSRQASTGIIKVTAYNKLKSAYLDAKANSLLEDEFANQSTVVTMFDIVNILLKGFSIQPDYEKITPGTVMKQEGFPLIESVANQGTLAFKLTKKYGVNNRLNYFEWTQLSHKMSTNAYFYLYSIPFDFRAEDNVYAMVNFLKGDFDYFEYSLYNFLLKVCDDAQLTKTGAQILENILSTDKWIEFCGFEIITESGSATAPTYTIKKYSTIQYNYDKSHNVSNCDGTIKDFLNKVHNIYGGSTQANCTYIRFYMPVLYGMVASDGTGVLCEVSPYEDNPGRFDLYRYYMDSSLTVLSDDIILQKEVKVNENEYYIVPYGIYGVDITDYFEGYVFTEMSDVELIEVTVSDIPNFTLGDVISAIYEMNCQYGKLDRTTDLFAGVSLNYSRLLPADTLYPANALYPGGNSESSDKSLYSQLWTDSGGIQNFKYLIITYKGLDSDGNEKDYTLQRTVNTHGTTNYNMSDNWIFRNLVWTANQVAVYAEAMVEKMKDVKWFPFEMWCAGLPYLETGDEIEVITEEGTYTSYVLQRQLKGIHNLQDTYINGTLDVF